MSEAQITAAIIRYLRKLDNTGNPIFWFKIHGSPQQTAGIPDLVVIYRGRTYWLEVKATKGKLSKLQAHRMKQIQDAGGAAEVVRSVKDVAAILKED